MLLLAKATIGRYLVAVTKIRLFYVLYLHQPLPCEEPQAQHLTALAEFTTTSI
jgi:hypothetical protein